jgi:hypothetical protein
LRLGCAVYPVRCVVVDQAPGDIVLGSPFRRRFDTALPEKFKPTPAPHGQGMGVTHVCLGVPEGYGVQFPSAGMRKGFHPRAPAEVAFKQVLRVRQSWQNWKQTGKELSADELQSHLGLPSPSA